MKRGQKKVLASCAVLYGVYIFLGMAAKRRTEEKAVDADNPYIRPIVQGEEQKGRQDETQKKNQDERRKECRSKRWEQQNGNHVSVYEYRVKHVLDRILSFCGLVLLSPVFVVISLAIVIDDPGPVLFTQKRVGRDKNFFMLHKFRSMKMKAPHDIPTHQLKNPEQYITRVGKFLRKYSLDELPQIWDIFRGRMSIIGPRPALWNQADLVAERDKYGANNILPGLTGWAQINGRDELEIADKARLDGEYAKKLRQGSMKALFFDVKCFLGTVLSVLDSDGVVEGGTGELHKARGCRVQRESIQPEKNGKEVPKAAGNANT